jgi:hypothetical protein
MCMTCLATHPDAVCILGDMEGNDKIGTTT